MKSNKTGVIVIDMQADYIGEKSKHQYYSQSLIDKINNRIDTAAKQDEIIIYVKNVGRRNKEPYICEFVDGLSVVSDFIVEKEKASIFSNTTLLDILKRNEIINIEIIGIDGNCCVASSAIDASKLGFCVKLPLDYIGIKSEDRFRKTREKLLKANVQIVEYFEG